MRGWKRMEPRNAAERREMDVERIGIDKGELSRNALSQNAGIISYRAMTSS